MDKDHPVYPMFAKAIKKHKKPHIINSKDNVIGNSLSIGNPGYAKTSGNRREMELRWALNHKLFALYDGGARMDMSFFAFPSIEPFWKKPKAERGKLVGARRYPTELLYPITKHTPRKIPNIGRLFSIAISDLDENDLVAMVGSSSKDSIKGAFNYVKSKVNDETTPEDFLNMLIDGYKKGEKGVKLDHHGVKKLKEAVFQPLINEGLLTSKKAQTCINFKEIIKDKKNISVLVLRHVPQSLWGFLVFFFMNHISRTLSGIDDTKRIKQKTTIVLNEVADLLDNDDEKGSSSFSINKMIAKIAKQSRTFDIFMLLDTQIPSELPSIRDTMKRVYVYNSSLPSIEKAMEITGVSTRTGEVTTDDLQIIPHLSPGWYYLFDRDNGVFMGKQVWTRSRTWKDGDDFYDIYEKVYGKMAYYDTTPILEEIKKENEKSRIAWESKEKILNKSTKELIEKEVEKEVDKTEEKKVIEDGIEIMENNEKAKKIPELNKEIIKDEDESEMSYESYKKIMETI